MDEIKGYFKAVKEIALDTWNGVLNADEEDVKCMSISILTFIGMSIFVTSSVALVVASIVVGLAYAKHTKTKTKTK